jgi:hypothetical protein
MQGTLAQWLSMFALSNIPLHISDMIFAKPSELTENNHARELGRNVLILWYFAWITVMGAVTWFRYRRLTP